LNQRTGLELGSDVIPIQPAVSATIGGIPVDEHGRAVNGEWGNWMSGLYAVGDAASSGFHGASMAWGNRLLDDLLSGRDAGNHAGKWAAANKAAPSSLLEESRQEVEANINDRLLNDSDSSKIGAVRSSLRSELNAGMSLQRDGESMEKCLAGLAQLKEISTTVNVEDSSLLMNTNLLEALRLENACLLAHMATSAALFRCESRGSHLRSDNEQRDDDNCLKHSLVSMEGDVSNLPIRMSVGGVWILAPEA
jgi:succinate dehydrogenase / fumarate reductase flavoprotein subunit